GFYNPVGLEYTELLRINSQLMPLSDLVDPDRNITNGVRGPDWQNSKYKLIRLQDCDHWTVNHEEAESISSSQFEENRRCRLKVNDIVVAIGGYVGNAAVLTEDCFAVIGQHSAVLPEPEKKGIDSRYLLAYLNSKVAEAIFSRYVSGTVQAGINLEDLRILPAPIVDLVAQKYIGDKVRQAEQLRAWAKSVKQQAAELLPAYICEIQRYEAKSYRAKDIVPERLDSLFYHPDYIALERKMKAKGCNRLGLVAKQIKDSWNKKKAETFEYYEIGGLDITTGQVLSTKTQTVGAPSRAKTKVQQGDVLVSTVRPNRKNVGFIVDSVTDSEMVATSGFSVLRFSSLARAAFYHAWLRTDDATVQLMRWNSGSAYPAIDDDVPLNIIVPEFEQEFVDSWGQKLLDAQFAYVYARKLTEVAKTLVEALIEGQLTEQQLIQARQALEDGDNGLDRAILSKLSIEGYAIDGATPLFSDIDELYRLMESAAQAEAEA
ncbi:MAG: restriction endonuclease subunit S, partial [Shewanella sp.]|nr:restriction endonuclease subunit S [Shewanella sp.]